MFLFDLSRFHYLSTSNVDLDNRSLRREIGLKRSLKKKLDHGLKIDLKRSLPFLICLLFGSGCLNEAPPKQLPSSESLEVLNGSTSSGHASSSASSNVPSDHVSSEKSPSPSSSSSISNQDDSPFPRAIEEVRPSLELKVVQTQLETHPQKSTVQLVYHPKSPTAPSPRAAEIFIEYDSTINLSTSNALTALEQAQKHLIVQKPQEGVLRLIIYGTNLNPIPAGPLASLTFSGDLHHQYVHIRHQAPVFAPSEANEGFIFAIQPTRLGEVSQ